MQFWKMNGHFVIEGGYAILCERCPCLYFLDFIKLVIQNGNIGTPEIIEVDVALGVTENINLVVNYFGEEYGVELEFTAEGPEVVCGPNIEGLDFNFKFIISEEPENEEQVLVSTVPASNINCVTPNLISRIPYEGTLETHTASVSACGCQCFEDEAFEAVYNLQTTGGTTPPPPPEVSTPIEVQEPVDPVDPDTTEIRMKVYYCYIRCLENEE
jgi:hypothetical protein